MAHDLEHVLRGLGYKLAEDVWADAGRRSYVNSENADREFLRDLEDEIRAFHWRKHNTRLRAFEKNDSSEILEVEPGGSDTSGHFLHHFKWEREPTSC